MQSRAGYHHGDVRAALLVAAGRVLDEEGAGALSVRRLATEIGVSPSAPYRHFRDADDVLAAVAAEGFHALRAVIDAVDVGGKTSLYELGTAYVQEATAHPGRYAVMFSPTLAHDRHADLSDASRDAFDRFTAAVERATALPARVAHVRAFAFWVTLHGFADLALQGRATALVGDDALREVLDGAVDAVRRPVDG